MGVGQVGGMVQNQIEEDSLEFEKFRRWRDEIRPSLMTLWEAVNHIQAACGVSELSACSMLKKSPDADLTYIHDHDIINGRFSAVRYTISEAFPGKNIMYLMSVYPGNVGYCLRRGLIFNKRLLNQDEACIWRILVQQAAVSGAGRLYPGTIPFPTIAKERGKTRTGCNK